MEAAEQLGLYDKHHAWVMRVMLGASRERGVAFDRAWASSIQRMRAQPTMSADQVEELVAAKEQLAWTRPWWRWAYENRTGPPPPLIAPDALTVAPPVAESLGADPTSLARALVSSVTAS